MTIHPPPQPEPGPEIAAAPAPGSAPPKFDPRYGDNKTPPEWKKDVLNGQPGAWKNFNKSLGNLPGITDTEKFVFDQIFAAEGGNRVAPRSDASSGILLSTLEAAKASGKVPGLDKVTSPKDVTADQKAAVMKWYFDGALGKVGGSKMLDGLNDKAAANAMADVLYRFGGAALRTAINKAAEMDMVDPKGPVDARTFEAYRQLVDDPKTRDRLLNAIAERFDAAGERG